MISFSPTPYLCPLPLHQHSPSIGPSGSQGNLDRPAYFLQQRNMRLQVWSASLLFDLLLESLCHTVSDNVWHWCCYWWARVGAVGSTGYLRCRDDRDMINFKNYHKVYSKFQKVPDDELGGMLFLGLDQCSFLRLWNCRKGYNALTPSLTPSRVEWEWY